MKKSTFILLGILVVMMAVAYFIKKPTKTEEATYATPDIQVSLPTATLVKIEIDRPGKYVRLERIRGAWKITEPIHFDVDEETIGRLLKGVANFKITGLVSTNPDKQKVFQVDEQGTTVIFTDENSKSETIVIGKFDPKTRQTFVRPEKSASVYIAQGLDAPTVNRELREWRKRLVYKTDPGGIKVVSIIRGGEKFTIRKRADRWLTAEKSVPPTLMDPVILNLSQLRAEDFIDTAMIVSAPVYMQVELAGKEESFQIDIYSRRAQGQYFAKTSVSPNLIVINSIIPRDVGKIVDYLATPPPEEQPAVVPPAPTQTQVQEPRPSVPAQQTPTGQGSGDNDTEGELIIHTVQPGETIEAIAKKYGVTVEQIMKWNQLKKPSLKPALELYIFVKR